MPYSEDPILFRVTENTTVAIIRKKIPNNLSKGVLGEISPYPTVFIVVTAQYNEFIYLTDQSSSYIL